MLQEATKLNYITCILVEILVSVIYWSKIQHLFAEIIKGFAM